MKTCANSSYSQVKLRFKRISLVPWRALPSALTGQGAKALHVIKNCVTLMDGAVFSLNGCVSGIVTNCL